MKKYTSLLAVMILSLLCSNEISAKVDRFHVSDAGKVTFGVTADYLSWAEVVQLFTTGSQAGVEPTYDLIWPSLDFIYGPSKNKADFEELMSDIEVARLAFHKAGGLVTNKAGFALLQQYTLTKNEIMDLFISGAWKDDQDQQSITNAITNNFVVQDNNSIQGLVTEIIREQTMHNSLRPDEIRLTPKGLEELGLPSHDEYMIRKDFILLFVTGSAKNMAIDSTWLENYTHLSQQQADTLVVDITTARAYGTLNPKKYMDIQRLDEANAIADQLVALG